MQSDFASRCGNMNAPLKTLYNVQTFGNILWLAPRWEARLRFTFSSSLGRIYVSMCIYNDSNILITYPTYEHTICTRLQTIYSGLIFY